MMPSCVATNPECGSCNNETVHDGDSFYCDDCGLDYGDGEDETVATYRDDDASMCGKFTEYFDNGRYAPCALPEGHRGAHWHRFIPEA